MILVLAVGVADVDHGLRMVFHVSGFSRVALGNSRSRPSDVLDAAVGGILEPVAGAAVMSSLPLGSSAGQCLPVLSCDPAPCTSPSF